MQDNRWLDETLCVICDYWWAFLLALLLALAAFLTRGFWLDLIFPQEELISGEVQVILNWEGANDLDLMVFGPTLEMTSYLEPISNSDGRLQFDSHGACEGNPFWRDPVENIYWSDGTAPSGLYDVYIFYSQICDLTTVETPYTITVINEGVVVFEDSGNVSQVSRNVEDLVYVTSFNH